MEKVFSNVDFEQRGEITRAQLRSFFGSNKVETACVVKQTNDHSHPVTESIIQLLELSESGLFDKNQVSAVVKQVAINNGVFLDPVSSSAFISDVFSTADFCKTGFITR